ncbi:hypothetical protein V501_04426 [Pseudogymnoascus sp. VKM F-4519 (FW-2642)]|nr:hypothetical protein V501_04426 [Pseudogymnoascus sp. VKM F-4519 (FW-2642)]
MYLERSNFDLTATSNIDGGVSTISGRTVLMRTDMVKNSNFAHAYLNEIWLFGTCGPLLVDDDKFPEDASLGTHQLAQQADGDVRGKACMEAAAVVGVCYILRHYHQHRIDLRLSSLVDALTLWLGNWFDICILLPSAARKVFNSLIGAFQDETATGTLIRKFYPENFRREDSRTPVFQYRQFHEPRPVGFTSKPTYTYSNILDFVTCQGFGCIELSEYDVKQNKMFNDAIHILKVVDVPGMPSYLYGQLTLKTKRPLRYVHVWIWL